MNTPDTAAPKADANRTNLALDRTVLANERTYAAWIRTGLAALATGLGIAKFMTGILPVWSIRFVVATLLVFSAVAFLVAAWRYGHLHIRVAHLEVDAVPLSITRILSLVLVCCSLVSLSCLWYIAT